MNYKIRKFNWKKLNPEGLPKDAAGTMKFFNAALEKKLYPFIPSDSAITKEVIFQKWMPYSDQNIGYVAEDKDEGIVGAGILFVLDKDSSEFQIALHPEFIGLGIGTDITKSVIDESKTRMLTFVVHTSTENFGMQKILKKLGYRPIIRIKNYPKYTGKIDATVFDAYEYVIK